MLTNACLLTCALLLAQAPDRPAGPLTPRLTRGQELVYSGSYEEEAAGRGVQFSRKHRLEIRAFVTEAHERGYEVALLTTLRHADARAEGGGVVPAGAVRLERLRVDPQGRVSADPGVPLRVPLDGPPLLEAGAFVEVPNPRNGPVATWELADGDRPPRVWAAQGPESVSGTGCLLLEGVQQTEDWDAPRGNRPSWRRRDRVWFWPRLGVAYRVERTVERRDPTRGEATQRSVTRYEMESSLTFPAELYRDRVREVELIHTFQSELNSLVQNPARTTPRSYEPLLARIGLHLEKNIPTPYREALLHVKRRAEAARRGETPVLTAADADAPPAVATQGYRAPDFVGSSLIVPNQTLRLRSLVGRPVVLVFYHPASRTADDVLRFAQKIQEDGPPGVAVVGLSLGDDRERVRVQYRVLALTFPVLSGSGLRQLYGVEGTPRLMVLDAEGVVRGCFEGWGAETAGVIQAELKRWLPRQPAER